MGKFLYPDIHITTAFDIDLKILKNKGINNIIVDIDNTLSKWGSKKPEPHVCEWIVKLRNAGFNICVLSNSSKKRICNYCLNLDVLYVENVRKPLKSSFISAMKLMDSTNENTCVIGDQIFTDILGGNLCGLYTILVEPISTSEFFLTKLSRMLGKVILK